MILFVGFLVFSLASLIFLKFWFMKPKVYRLIFLLRLMGDGKSADEFIRKLKAIKRANASPQYDFSEIDNPHTCIYDMQKIIYKQVRDESYTYLNIEKTIKIELPVYHCINSKGKFVATTDHGKNWYLTGEDDAQWRKRDFELEVLREGY